MRKQTKIAAVVSAAALLALGASMTSFAATGWQEENGTWVYYDRSGNQVTNTWAKSGDNWFYLNDNGEMAVDTLIEDDNDRYYVDANGAMVTNQWVALDNQDAGDDANQPNAWWYYFGSNGKAYKTTSTGRVSLKTINGKKYTFNEDGHMLYGWVNDNGEMVNSTDEASEFQDGQYYFGDETDGAMATGWREISIYDDSSADEQPGDGFWDGNQTRWFYFKSSGKKTTNEKGKTVNGKKYGFDQYGRMLADWHTFATTSDATVANGGLQGNKTYSETFKYFSTPEDGARKTKGWFKVVPGYFLNKSDYDDGSNSWFYADGDGNIVANEVKTINGKKYAFDEYGQMVTGLHFFQMSGTKDIVSILDSKDYDTNDEYDKFYNDHAADIANGTIAAYYFGNSDDGSMKTGAQNVDLDGESYKFQFKTSSSTKGQGTVGVDNHKLYMAGKLAKASNDDKVTIFQYKADGTITAWDTADFIRHFGAIDAAHTNDNHTTYAITTTAADGDFYAINTTGGMIKSGSKKDGDDYKIHTTNYKVDSIEIDN